MTGVHKKLDDLSDDVTWFACATDLRVHVVYAEHDIAESVLRLILRGSRVTDRPTPYLVFIEPFAARDAGWTERVQTLVDAREVLSEELEARGSKIAPSSRTRTPLENFGTFAMELIDLAHATTAACAAPVVVLAPTAIESPEWIKEVEALIEQPRLAPIRWVIVVPSEVNVATLVSRLGGLALVSDCRTSPSDDRAVLAGLLANSEGAAAGATPLALLGMAWARVVPPPRRTTAGTTQPSYEPTKEERAKLAARLALMRAALALSSRVGPDAITNLRAASDALVAANLPRESLIVRLVLATSISTLGERKLACRELDNVAGDATRLGLHALAAQCACAKASLLASAQDTNGAMEAYAVSIEAARKAGEDALPLLIAVLRATGQLCLATKQTQRADTCFRQASSLQTQAEQLERESLAHSEANHAAELV